MIWLRITAAFGNFTKNQQGCMSTENFLKPSNRKDCRGVVLANILESVGHEFLWIIARPTHIAFAIFVAEKSTIWAVYMFDTRRNQEKKIHRGKPKRCLQRRKRRGKKNILPATTPDQNNRSPSVKSQRVKSPE